MGNHARFIACFLILVISSGSSFGGGILFVARDGTGDYNCNGINDHIEIQRALNLIRDIRQSNGVENAPNDTLYLKTGTYNISGGGLYLHHGITLTGDSTAVLKKNPSNFPLFRHEPDLQKTGITISDIGIDGGGDGQGSYFLAKIEKGNQITIKNIKAYNDLGKLLIINSRYVDIHNNKIKSIEAGVGNFDINISNNIIMSDSIGINLNKPFNRNLIIYNNRITGGVKGINVNLWNHSEGDPLKISNNTIFNANSGIFIRYAGGTYTERKYVHIHNNLIFDCDYAGIDIGEEVNLWQYGMVFALLYNNVVDGCTKGININQPPLQVPRGPVWHGGGKIILRNNIISNSNPENKISGGGIRSGSSLAYKLDIYYNCFFNNFGEDFPSFITTQVGNIFTDPVFADRENRDYHLKSNVGRWNGTEWVYDNVRSPCIAAGDPDSDYSEEPLPNGGRVNIGRYGNTPLASKSWSVGVEENAPGVFSLSQNIPNPFNPSTTIIFSIPRAFPVKLEIFDISGRKIDTLVNGIKEPGNHYLEWKPENLASGMYLYRIQAGSYTETKKMLFLK